ncbi:MAG: MaoC family dehydratase [Anaerolineales bacterium]
MTISVGQIFTHRLQVTDALIRGFAEISGDHNPLHLDDDFAAKTRFGRRVAHGMLVGSLVVATLGQTFPGAIHLSQTFSFKQPVYVDDHLVATLEVVAWRAQKRIATVGMTLANAAETIVLQGEAVILLPEVL